VIAVAAVSGPVTATEVWNTAASSTNSGPNISQTVIRAMVRQLCRPHPSPAKARKAAPPRIAVRTSSIVSVSAPLGGTRWPRYSSNASCITRCTSLACSTPTVRMVMIIAYTVFDPTPGCSRR
jgi:hypothetical protein